jgi:hypothetical protein
MEGQPPPPGPPTPPVPPLVGKVTQTTVLKSKVKVFHIKNETYTQYVESLKEEAQQITLVIVSDTHNYAHHAVPEGDVLIHAGTLHW